MLAGGQRSKKQMPYKPQTEAESKRAKPIVEPDDVARSRRLASYWKQQIKEVDEHKKHKAWHKRSIDIIKRFKDDRDKASEEGQRRLNTFWGWYETIKPAVYGQVPKAEVERAFLDKDTLGRVSADILERTLANEMRINGFQRAMERVVQDYLLVGRGQAWVRYEPVFAESDSLPPTSYQDEEDELGEIEPNKYTTEDVSDEDDIPFLEGMDDKLEDTGSTVEEESAPVDYVPWTDFKIYPPRARTWDEVQAVSKDIWLSKDDCIKYFGEDVGHALEAEPVEPDRNQYNDFASYYEDKVDDKRKITEIWDKKTRRVYWVNNSYPYLCKEEDDPLELTHFFPCPEPLYSIITNDSLIPIPFYHQFQDQALQIDELTQRINMLTKSLKVVGVYAADVTSLRRLLDENTENAMIPVDDWAALGDKGLEGTVSFMPIQEVAEVLTKLIEVRQTVMQDMDLITGISDILRGTSDARETMGGQRLKANAAGTRVEAMRKNVGRFAEDIVRLLAEVVCKNFQPKTLIEASGIFYEMDIPNEQGLAVFQMLPLLQAMGLGQASSPSLVPPQAPPLALPPPQPPATPTLPTQAMPQQPTAGLPMAPQQGAPGVPPQAPGLPVAMARPPMAMPAPPQPQPNPLAPIMAAVQAVKKAIDLLRKDAIRGYRISVEIDTMVAGDHMQERQDATQFTQAIGAMLQEMVVAIQQMPLLTPALVKTFMWNIRKYRCGREVEAAWGEVADQVAKQAQEAQQNPQQKPNPETIKAQSEQMKAQAEIAKAKLDMQAQQANDQREQQLNQQDMQIKLAEANMRMKEMQLEMQRMQLDHNNKMQEMQIKHTSALTGMPVFNTFPGKTQSPTG